MCVGFRGICFDDFIREFFKVPIKNNLDLYDPIGGLSENGVLREPPETHLDLPLNSTMTLLLLC